MIEALERSNALMAECRRTLEAAESAIDLKNALLAEQKRKLAEFAELERIVGAVAGMTSILDGGGSTDVVIGRKIDRLYDQIKTLRAACLAARTSIGEPPSVGYDPDASLRVQLDAALSETE